MAVSTVPARLVEIESMLDRSRRRFEEGTKLVEEAHRLLADVQQSILGSPRSISPEDSEEAASRLSIAAFLLYGLSLPFAGYLAESLLWCGVSLLQRRSVRSFARRVQSRLARPIT